MCKATRRPAPSTSQMGLVPIAPYSKTCYICGEDGARMRCDCPCGIEQYIHKPCLIYPDDESKVVCPGCKTVPAPRSWTPYMQMWMPSLHWPSPGSVQYDSLVDDHFASLPGLCEGQYATQFDALDAAFLWYQAEREKGLAAARTAVRWVVDLAVRVYDLELMWQEAGIDFAAIVKTWKRKGTRLREASVAIGRYVRVGGAIGSRDGRRLVQALLAAGQDYE